MTTSGQILAGAALPPASRTIWREEMIDTIKLALPIALTQLGQVAMMIQSTVMMDSGGRARRDGQARRPASILAASRPSASNTFLTMPLASRPALAYIALGES